MALADCQVQVRDLVMGPGTPYRVLPGFNPFNRAARADQSDTRAWNHGGWSGAEWAEESVVPIPLSVTGADRDVASWVQAQQALAAAFAPVGDSQESVELRWMLGGIEYMMLGRPRMVEPTTDNIAVGKARTQCAFAALDPRIYSADVHTTTLGLPSTSGGLSVPFTVPFTVDATVTSGRATLANAGTATVGLTLRIDGPVDTPRVSLLTADGVLHQITVHMSLESSQWLDIDTAARTVLLQGTADRRGLVSSNGRWPLLPPGGGHEVAFDADVFEADAQLSASWRDAWF